MSEQSNKAKQGLERIESTQTLLLRGMLQQEAAMTDTRASPQP